MLRARCLGAAVGLAVAALWAQPAPTCFESVPFVAGEGGYHTYRIPAIVRSSAGTLLAFCEGRKTSSSDSGDIDIVLRRSTNSGTSWLSLSVVQEEGGTAPITIGNPVPVVDESTGAIHLLFCRNNDRVFHTMSTNDGVGWSTRTEITANVKAADWGWYATGPGHGLQLKRGAQAGRLVVPCDHINTNGVHGVHVVYSDDHGMTWRLGGVAEGTGGVNPNETQCVELVANVAGGSRIYFNSRDQNGSASGTRAEAWSTNGGTGFAGSFTNRAAFVCPVVQGSVLRWRATDEGSSSNRILFACPNHPSARVLLSVWSSASEALSWSEPKVIFDGPSAYSDMACTLAGEIALLYERGEASPYETITLSRFNEAWVDSGATLKENPAPAFWNFEEKAPGQTTSTNAGAILDVHPYGLSNHLTAQKALAYVLASTNYGGGTAIAFDGSGGLQISDTATANHFDFGATNAFTIEAVFRIPSGSTQTGALVAKDYGQLLPSWWLRVESGKLRFLICDGLVEVVATAGSPLVNDGQWHHVAAVRDTRLLTAKLLRLYLDGILLTNVSDNSTESLANAQPLNIGRFGAASTRNLTGDIDMVRLTPKALAPADFLGHWTQFDADEDWIPDKFERATYGSLEVLGAGDNDGDGFADVVEFALGADPCWAASQPSLTVTPGPNYVAVTTRQRELPPWLELRLESSSDLAVWTPLAATPVLTALPDGTFLRSQTVLYPSGAPPALFLRQCLSRLP